MLKSFLRSMHIQVDMIWYHLHAASGRARGAHNLHEACVLGGQIQEAICTLAAGDNGPCYGLLAKDLKEIENHVHVSAECKVQVIGDCFVIGLIKC